MTRDKIIRMAREAGFDAHDMSDDFTCNLKDIIRFYELAYAAGAAYLCKDTEWKEAVIHELIVAGIYTKEHETKPKKAVHDAINWNCQVALDPCVSSDAIRLIADEREACAKVCEAEAQMRKPTVYDALCECADSIRARGEK